MQTSTIQEDSGSKGKLGFILVLVYLLIDYGRPMDDISFLKAAYPGAAIIVLLILACLTSGRPPLFKGKQTKVTWLFIFLLAAYVPIAVNNHWAYMSTITVLKFMPFFIAVILFVNSFDRLKKLFGFWVLLMFYLAIRGIINKGIGGSSFLGDENDFSLLMNMMIPFGISFALYERNFRKKIYYLTASVLAIMSVLASFSRGGFVGLVAVVVCFWLFSPRKVLALAFVGLFGVVVYFTASEKYWARIETATATNEGTAKERLDSWKAGWEMFKDHPLGVGGGNFPVLFHDYQPGGMRKNMWGRAAHSLYFTLLPELGIFGAIIYGMLLFYNLKDIFWLKKVKAEGDDELRFAHYLGLAFLASLMGYFTSGTFLSVLYYPHYFYVTAMIVASRNFYKTKLTPVLVSASGDASSGDDDRRFNGRLHWDTRKMIYSKRGGIPD